MELHLRHQGARELEGSDNVSAVPVLRRIGANTGFEDLKGNLIARQTRGSIHSDFANLLLGDEGEGEPLVASPPCAADSVQSVQREQTSPPTKSLLLLYFQCWFNGSLFTPIRDAIIMVGLHWQEYLVPVNIVFIVVGAIVVHNKHQFLNIQAASTYTKLPISILKKGDL